jgi:hypothetical protein
MQVLHNATWAPQMLLRFLVNTTSARGLQNLKCEVADLRFVLIF